MQDFLAAIALVFVIEGLMPFLAPGIWRQTMEQASQLPDRSLRIIGAISMIIGLVVLFQVR